MPSPAFPDTAGLQKSADGTEFIYGGSVGINRILGLLRTLAFGRDRTDWMLYLINAYTVFDNVYHKSLTAGQLQAAFDLDCDLLARYIEAYAAARPFDRRPPTILFYVPTYDAVPAVARRERSAAALAKDAAYAALAKLMPAKAVDITQTEDSVRWLVPVGAAHSWPHRDLARWLVNNGKKVTNRLNLDPVAVITHCAVDLHLHRDLAPLSLLERYTGLVKSPKEFGSKLVKEDVDIPFNTVTHNLFGDGVHLKPLVAGKERKQLLELAKARRWMLRPEADIARDVTTATDLALATLTRVKF